MAITIPASVLHNAAACFELDPGELDALERFGAPDGAVFPCLHGGTDAFLKIKPISQDALSGEHDRLDIVTHLRGHVRVPTYLPSTNDDLLEAIEHDGALYAATLSKRAPGRHVRIPEDFTAGFVRAWATTLGQMHATLRTYDGGSHLPTWSEEHASFLSGCRDDAVRQVWCELGEKLGELPTDPDGYGIVHNDLHVGNLLMDDDGSLTVLDFDVCSRHWFATDLAIVLAHPIWDMRKRDPDGIQPFVDTVLDAYTAAYPLDDAWLTHLPLLMRYRMALFTLAMANEGENGPRPPWLEDVRTWVLSGEPLAHPHHPHI